MRKPRRPTYAGLWVMYAVTLFSVVTFVAFFSGYYSSLKPSQTGWWMAPTIFMGAALVFILALMPLVVFDCQERIREWCRKNDHE